MGEENVGYEDWDKIVKNKEASLKVIAANERNLEVGREVEELVLGRARRERDKYPKPEPEPMEETETPEEEEESTESA